MANAHIHSKPRHPLSPTLPKFSSSAQPFISSHSLNNDTGRVSTRVANHPIKTNALT